MTIRGIPAPELYQPNLYWEDRARRFAGEGDGLAAVCSYGMPRFYNRAIHWTQRHALAPWLRITPGMRVLDIGCGIGRWSRLLAARGARVTGIDLSPTMIREAQRRTQAAGLAERCRFLVQDSSHLDAGDRFDLVLGVTVLQHILDRDALQAAVAGIARHASAQAPIVLLEAAPTARASRCDSTVFQARQRQEYLALFERCGLQLRAMSGVDVAPFRTLLLPHLPRLRRPLAVAALAAATALSVPIDALLGRRLVERSWHAVFVLQRRSGGDPYAR
jgi:SAM-dependent methyltransferase